MKILLRAKKSNKSPWLFIHSFDSVITEVNDANKNKRDLTYVQFMRKLKKPNTNSISLFSCRYLQY